MYNILAFVSIFVSCYFFLCIYRHSKIVESILFFFVLFSAHVAVFGYTLSMMKVLSDIKYWAIIGSLVAVISGVLAISKGRFVDFSKVNFSSLFRFIQRIKYWYIKEVSFFEKIVVTPLILTVLVLGGINLIVIVYVAPHNWDSMTYHLARVAFFFQNNSIESFPANYWAQVVHPKNSSLLLLYTYLILGKSENAFQLVQFASYWVSILSVYAISIKIGYTKVQSIFTALVSGLLTEWLMQATTTQNDLLITAYVGCAVYFLFAFRDSYNNTHIFLAALNIGLAIGTKASAFLPSIVIAFVALSLLFQLKYKIRNLAVLGGSVLLAICIFALPAGYIENYKNYRNLTGPEFVRQSHSFEGKSIEYITQNGTKNLIRFGFDFLSLDGFPAVSSVSKIQAIIKWMPEKISHKLALILESPEGTRRPFKMHKIPSAHEDVSYWGIMGFGLVWLTVILALIGIIKQPDIRLLAIATVLFLFIQAYIGPYDPWRGRYFTTAAIFAVPIVGIWLKVKNRLVKTYLLLIVFAGSVSAASAVTLRKDSRIISHHHDPERKSIFKMNRMEQLTRNRRFFYKPLTRFDSLVPKTASVAVCLKANSFEYPLFGEYLSRTIVPINSFDKGLQAIPTDVNYLLYDESFLYPNRAEDIHIGQNWYLRSLNNNCNNNN